MNKKYSPDVVFAHSGADLHQDHGTVTQESLRAFRGTSLLGYDVIRSSYGFFPTLLIEVAEKDVHKYGIVAVEDLNAENMKVTSVVEKPSQEEAPSRLALPGRYIFTSDLFDYLENQPPGKNGEIQLTDAMTAEAQGKGLYATRFVAQRYDAGDKFGYLQANIELGLKHPQVGPALKDYLKNLTL